MAKRKKGSKRLTDLELAIMQVFWKAAPEPLPVRAVVERLEEHTGRSHAYTTVQTMMAILRRKGALRSKAGPGRAHSFSLGLSRDEATSSMTRDFVERMFGGSARPLMTHLLEHESLDRDALEELKRLIDDQLEDE